MNHQRVIADGSLIALLVFHMRVFLNDCNRGDTFGEFLQKGPHEKPGMRCPQTKMGADPESHMGIGLAIQFNLVCG